MSAESGLDFMPGSEVIADSKPQQSVGFPQSMRSVT